MNLEQISRIVGVDNVLTDPTERAPFERDWTGRFIGSSPAVVLPATTGEVSAVLQLCNQKRVAIVPQGGNTGHVGGSVPLHKEIVLSTRRLNVISAINTDVPSITVGAGVTLGNVLGAARVQNLGFGVDLHPKDEATIGGMIATNAGGLRFLRYGSMRHQLLGVEVVLADGTVVSHLGGLPKDNTGYDLANLFCGSEGTLGIVTAATVKLVPLPACRATALVSVSAFEEALGLVKKLRGSGRLESAEVMFPPGVAIVAEHLGEQSPLDDTTVQLVVEVVGATDPSNVIVRELNDKQYLLAVDDEARALLWRWRTNHSAAIGAYCRARGFDAPQKYDVSVPLRHTTQFLNELDTLLRASFPETVSVVFGHIGDGNLHINLMSRAESKELDALVLELTSRHQGSISAEHGIGTAKAKYLHLSRSPEEIRVFRMLKHTFDPNGIMNPHVMLP